LSVCFLWLDCVVFGGFLLLRSVLPPAAAQMPATSAAGRYNLASGAGGALYFTDTQTGRVWIYSTILQNTKSGESKFIGMRWTEMDTPLGKVN